MSLVKKVIAGILAVTTCLTFAACGGSDTDWIIKEADGTTIPAGIYLTYLVQALGEASLEVEDLETPPYEQTIDGIDGNQWVKDRALSLTKQYIATNEKFDELGMTLDETTLEDINYYIDSFWNGLSEEEAYMWYMYGLLQAYNWDGSALGEIHEKNGISYESYSATMITGEKSAALFNYYYDEGGIEEVSEEELLQACTSNYAAIKPIVLSFTDSNGQAVSDEEKENLKNMAEDYKQRLENGENIDDLIDEYSNYVLERDTEESETSQEESSTESSETSSDESSIDSAETSSDESSTDPAETSSDESSTDSTETSSETSDTENSETSEPEEDPDRNLEFFNRDALIDSIRELFFNAEYGEVIYGEEDFGYIVAIRYDITESEEALTNYRSSLLHILRDDAFEEMLVNLADSMNLTVNQKAIDYYAPSKIKAQ